MASTRIRRGVARSRFALLVAIGSLLFAADARAQTLRFDVAGLDRIDRLGASLAIVGDLDGDGFADLLVGAPGDASSDLPSRVCLFTGAPSSLLATAYRTIASDQLQDGFGAAVAALGDLDGDGATDFAVGAPARATGGSGIGELFVYSGANGALIRTLTSATGPFGAVLAAIGDVDGDGTADLLVSDTLPAGPAVTLLSGATGVALRTHVGAAGSGFGATTGSLDHCGDVDGDGVEDYVVGAPNDASNPAVVGLAYVYSGATGALLYQFDDQSIAGGFGTAVSGAGDVDLDGHADVLVGDPSFQSSSGVALVLSGATGAVLYTISSPHAALVGIAVSECLDVDGDGHGDFLVANQDRVRCYSGANGSSLTKLGFDGFVPTVVDGTTDFDHDGKPELLYTIPDRIDQAMGPDGYIEGQGTGASTWHFAATGSAYDAYFGGALTLLPDRDGDGIAELLVGETRRTDNHGGAFSVRSGRDGTLLDSVAPGAPADGFGTSVCAVGDVDGDGIGDAAIGAPYRANHGAIVGDVELRSGADDHLIATLAAPPNRSAFGSALAAATDASGHLFLAVSAPTFLAGGVVEIHDLTLGTTTLTVPADAGAGFFGTALACLGDVDGDGVLDWIATDPGGKNFVATAFSGSNGATLWTLPRNSRRITNRGLAVTPDQNGDGIDDVLIGSNEGPAGRVTLYSGADGTLLRRIDNPEAVVDGFGETVATLGDVNGDGFADFAVGAPLRDSPAHAACGAVFVLAGPHGDLLTRIDGATDGEHFGETLPTLPRGADSRVDLDAIPDLVVGAPTADAARPNRGSVALVTLDDLFLQIDPPTAAVGTNVTLATRGAPPNQLAGLFLTAIDGVPVGSFVAFGTFDAQQSWVVGGSVPAGASGHTLSFRSYALGYGGKVVDSTEMVLTVP
jgi:hypothetical protein